MGQSTILTENDIRGFKEHSRENRGTIQRFNSGGMAPARIIIPCMDLRDDPRFLLKDIFGNSLVIPSPGTIVRPKNGGTLMNSYLNRGIGKFGVRDIMLLGHSDCSAIRDLLHGSPHEDEMTFLQFAQNALDITQKRHGHENLPEHDFLTKVSEETLLLSARNLETYPIIQANQPVRIEAVMYDPRHHTLRMFDKLTQEWKIVADASEDAQALEELVGTLGHAHCTHEPGASV